MVYHYLWVYLLFDRKNIEDSNYTLDEVAWNVLTFHLQCAALLCKGPDQICTWYGMAFNLRIRGRKFVSCAFLGEDNIAWITKLLWSHHAMAALSA
jgi:hypothetical protein